MPSCLCRLVAICCYSLCLTVGCIDSPPSVGDLQPPTLLGSQPDLKQPLNPTGSLRLVFDEPLAHETLNTDSVLLLPYERGEACSVDLACGEGSCRLGRCQYDPVNAALLADLRNLPLGERWRQRAAPVALSLDGNVLEIRPRLPFMPHRIYALLVAPSLADVEGNAFGADPLRLEFVTDALERGRPTVELISPRAEATDLPTNLARLMLRSSQPLSKAIGEDRFWLEEPKGEKISLKAEAADDLCSSKPDKTTCLRLRLSRALTPLKVWTLRFSSQVTNNRGEAIFFDERLRFASGVGPDNSMPQLTRCLLYTSPSPRD